MFSAILIHCLLLNIIIYSKTIHVISSSSSSLSSPMNFIEVKRIFRFTRRRSCRHSHMQGFSNLTMRSLGNFSRMLRRLTAVWLQIIQQLAEKTWGRDCDFGEQKNKERKRRNSIKNFRPSAFGLRPRWITPSLICRILHILRKPNSIIANYMSIIYQFLITMTLVRIDF